MNKREIYYKLHSGKNSKLAYYITSYARLAVPGFLLHLFLKRKLAKAKKRADWDYITDRVNYYCKLTPDSNYDKQEWNRQAIKLKDQKLTKQKVYYLDSMRYARWFPKTLQWILKPGDISVKMELPAIVKSRPIGNDNQCSVLLKLDAVRHYIFVKDKNNWTDKRNMAIFRGGG